MKAVQLTTFGVGPAALDLVDCARPRPGDGEVLIEVHAVSASKLELEQTMAGIGLGRAARLPRILGMDPAGVVVGQGSGVVSDRVGERVAVKPNLVCGSCRFCLAGAEADCLAQQQLGVHRDGGLAEYVVVPARQAFPIDDALDFTTASAGVHSVAVAQHMLTALGNLGPGDTVVVLGATGAVGSAAAQLARGTGASVIAGGSSRDRLETVLGALPQVSLVEYGSEESFTGEVRALAPGGVQAVLDTTGSGDLFAASIALLAWRGVAVTCASQPGEEVVVQLSELYRRRRSLIGVGATDFADVKIALAALAAGQVTMRVARSFALAGASEAYVALADRQRIGKVLVLPRA